MQYKEESMKVFLVEEKSTPTPAALLFKAEEESILPCIFGFEPWCWVREYQNPVIDFLIHAVEASDVHVYLAEGKITGRITTIFHNLSKEGLTWWKNVRTGETTEKKKVKGSADLNGHFGESIYILNPDVCFCSIKNAIRRNSPQTKIEINTAFTKTGYGNMIKSILEILLTGCMYVEDEIEVKVSYLWRGYEYTIKKRFQIRAWLPVKNVTYSLW